MTRLLCCSAALLVAVASLPSVALATVPYGTLSGGIPGGLGPGLPLPSIVPGKEYSHDVDMTTLGAGGVADPQQIIAWDGSGGVGDGLDYTGTRPTYTPEDEVDATANRLDHLFNQLIGDSDRAHLIFSHDDMISVYPTPAAFVPFAIPSAGPVALTNGSVIGGAGELSFEIATAYAPPSTQGVWATQPAINLMPLPRDVDGVELWGPEPGFTGDADKYSLEVDAFSGTSVWNLSGSTYITHAMIVAAVTSPAMLGPVPGTAVLPYPDFIDGNDAINLDALMVQDIISSGDGGEDTFDRDPTGDGVGDRIIFSIRQIPDPADPDGYYATGSELFVLDASTGPAGTTYLFHGGHLWDHAYALSSLAIPPGFINNGHGVIDINAIEGVSQGVVPEPSSVLLALIAGGTLAAVARRQRKKSTRA